MLPPVDPFLALPLFVRVFTTSATLKARELTATGQVATALCRTSLTHVPMLAEIDRTRVTLTTLTDLVNEASSAWFPPASRPPKSSVTDAVSDTEVPFSSPRMGVLDVFLLILHGLELSWTMLLCSRMASAVHRLVSLGPRAITIIRWLPVILPSRPTTRMDALELSVLAGLLVSMTLGLPIRVWVTVMCRTRLLDSRPGPPPTRLFSLIRLRVPWVCLCCLAWDMLETASVSLMPDRTARRGTRPQSRNMKLTARPWHEP